MALYPCENVTVTLHGVDCAAGSVRTVELCNPGDSLLDQPFPLPTQTRANEVVDYVRGCDAGTFDRGNVQYSLDFAVVREVSGSVLILTPGGSTAVPASVYAVRKAHEKLKELENLKVERISINYNGIYTMEYNAVLDSAEGIYGPDSLENGRQWGISYSLTLSNLTLS